jgi:hypothetical protein
MYSRRLLATEVGKLALTNLRLTTTSVHVHFIRTITIYGPINHMADSSTQVGKTDSESPGVASHGGSPSTSRPDTPSTSKKSIQKLASWFQKPFPRSKGRKAEPTAASAAIAQDQNPQTTTTTVPDTLLVRTESIHFKENTVSPARKIAGYELAISVIDIFQQVVECTEAVLPSPVGTLLEKLTKALEVLKVGPFHHDPGSSNIMSRSKWWRIKSCGRNCF